MPPSSDLNCAFRRDVISTEQTESAVCGFIQQLTQLPGDCCRVDRTACELCLQHSPFAPPQMNPVMPSLVLSACSHAPAAVHPGTTAAAMKSWAESVVEAQALPCLVPMVAACDVVLVVSQPEAGLDDAVESICSQENAFPLLHLVGDGPDACSAVDRFSERAGVRVYRQTEKRGVWACIHELMPAFRTPWIAVQDASTFSHPMRLRTAIQVLQEERGDLFGAAVSVCGEQFESIPPTEDRYESSFQLSSLVIRRSALVDLGSFDLSRDDAGAEIVYRAHCEGRRICCHDDVLVTQSKPLFQTLGDPPAYLPKALALRTSFHGKRPKPGSGDEQPKSTWKHLRLAERGGGFPDVPVRCDVVLPFRDDFHFVREALGGLLNQVDAELTIHLVDDASRESTESLFDEYRGIEKIRLYRNERNLGPFATFNNVSEFAESPFIAVQDADDISAPMRMATLVRLLRNAGADIAASATELFGKQELIPLVAHSLEQLEDGAQRYVRESRYPCTHGRGYFLENPTLVMKVDAFRRLGGYADYGESRRSRTGVDTEFQQRAFFAQAQFAITREVLLKYRCHGSSATNHSASGFGSIAQQESQAETRRRFLHYATGNFDPRCFGALGQHFGVTRRL